MTTDIEAEIRDLRRRVDMLEGAAFVNPPHEKSVRNALLAFEARIDDKFDRIGRRFDRLDRNVLGDGILRATRHVVRKALREAGRRTKKPR